MGAEPLPIMDRNYHSTIPEIQVCVMATESLKLADSNTSYRYNSSALSA